MRSAADVSVAVIGCGYWGKNLVRNFAALGALRAVCDANQGLAETTATTYRVPAISFAEALQANVDALVIATPAVRHAELTLAALMAGRHVFVEKPLALDIDDAQQVCAAAEARGLTLMVGHLLQYHPAFLKLKEIVRAGEVGRLQYVYSNRLNLGKIRREEDILWSFAPHDISMILALAAAEPCAVAAVGAKYLHETIADVTTTHLSFSDGMRAHIFVSWLHPFKEQRMVVVGDSGMLVFDDGEPWESKLILYRHKIEWRDGLPLPARADGQKIVVPPAEPLNLECSHFLDCIARRERPRTDGREGLRVLKVLKEAANSMRRSGAAPPESAVSAARPSFPGVMIHESVYIDPPVEIGEGTRIWHFSHILPHSKIGRNCVIGQNAAIGPEATIGDNCKIQNNVSVYKGVSLEDGVFCGPSCVFTNVNNPRAEIERKSEFRSTLVKRGATIGANATILCGHTLGRYCFVAAGAVVADNVPDYALMAGVPAHRIGWMSRAGVKLGLDLRCPIEGRRYRETAPNQLEEIDEP